MKQVIVIRHDLKMSKGKLAAQVAHASVNSVLNSSQTKVNQWLEEGEKKIVLQVETEKELMQLLSIAKSKGLVASLIKDAGHTQLEPGTTTCLGIGPDSDVLIDTVTGKLKMVN